MDKPKIFCFNNGGSSGWYNAVAIAEDGTVLAQHVCSSPSWIPHDLGITSDRKHEHYRAHYPDGFELVLVEDATPGAHAGLDAAYSLNQAKAREAKEAAEAPL